MKLPLYSQYIQRILQRYVQDAVRVETNGIIEAIVEQNRILIEFLQSYMQKNVLLDRRVLVGELAPAMNTKLGEFYKYENRGNTR